MMLNADQTKDIKSNKCNFADYDPTLDKWLPCNSTVIKPIYVEALNDTHFACDKHKSLIQNRRNENEPIT